MPYAVGVHVDETGTAVPGRRENRLQRAVVGGGRHLSCLGWPFFIRGKV